MNEPLKLIYPRFSHSFSTWTIDIIAISSLLLFFYIFLLGNYPLFTPDEARYSEVAREMIITHDYITPRVNGIAFLDKPILYYWLQVIAIQLFGLKEWVIRLFPALTGVFGCLMVYICGRMLFDRRSGVLSAFVLASSALYFVHAHYANLDLEVAVFISTSLLFFITAMHTNKLLLLYGSYLFAALAFLTKGMIGIFFPTLIIGTWILLQWRFDILKKMHIFRGLLLFTVIVLPWYLLVQQRNPEFFHFFFITQQVTRFLSNAEFNNQSPFWFYLPIIFVGLFPWTGFILLATKETIAKLYQPTYLFLCLWASLILIFFSIPHSKIIGYILPVFPSLALIIGNYLSQAMEHNNRKQLNFNILIFQIINVLMAILLAITVYRKWVELPQDAHSYLYGIAIVQILASIVALLHYQQKSFAPLIATCISVSTMISLILLVAAPTLNQNSTKPLLSQLKTIIKPEDEIINYYKYYQDIPLYLERRVTVVNNWESPNIINVDNWARELWFGMPFQNTKEWLINEDMFWQRFQSSKHVYVFLNRNYFKQFKAHTNQYKIIAQHNDVILISNQ